MKEKQIANKRTANWVCANMKLMISALWLDIQMYEVHCGNYQQWNDYEIERERDILITIMVCLKKMLVDNKICVESKNDLIS